MHGANRLGTNSLLDINVFGRRAGIDAAEYAADRRLRRAAGRPGGAASSTMIESMRDAGGSERVGAIRQELQATMDINAQVYRTEGSLKQALADIEGLKARYANVSVQDKGQRFNTDLLEAIELGFLLDLAEVLVVSALARNESRGGHFREDYPTRDDVNFMRHTMAYRERRRTAGDPPGLQAGRRDPLQADGAQVLMDVTRQDPPLQPGGLRGVHLGELPGLGRADRPRPRRAAQDQVGPRRLADLPPLVRARRLRLGRDADQRQEPAGLQDAAQGRQPLAADHRRADQGPAGAQGPRRRHGAVLRRLPLGDAVPGDHRQRADPRADPVARPTGERFDDTTKCILCAACTTSCPVFWSDGQYFGPQAIVGAHRFIFDSRDEGTDQRLEILNDKEGVWRCRTTFNCTEACPRGIEVTKAIQEVKRALIFRR